jgi:ubiquinone/menaquinone biosynthesis C-methylase UbiE
MPKKSAYESSKAAEFWSQRLQSTDPLAAVLTYSAPKALNELYDRWERNSLTQAIGKIKKGTPSLDIGCGIGRITLTLAAMGAEVTGVDVSEKMLLYCAKEAKRRKLDSRVTLVRNSAELIPFSDNSFAIITCFGLLEHLPETPRKRCVSEALRLLKKRGSLYMVVNNAENLLLKPRYVLKTQRKDGYFATLVGLDWLKAECKQSNAKLSVIAANPHYALLHYGVLASGPLPPRELGRLCRLVEKADLASSPSHEFLLPFASHLLVRIQK